jgi:hypothetical protein
MIANTFPTRCGTLLPAGPDGVRMPETSFPQGPLPKARDEERLEDALFFVPQMRFTLEQALAGMTSLSSSQKDLDRRRPPLVPR